MKEIEWKKDYCTGYEIIDSVHENLFSIMRRILKICDDSNFKKNEFVCRESIKYLRNYAEKHFSEEEGIMRKIGYSKYEYHKELHDEFKNKTVDEFERKLINTDYSKEVTVEYIEFFYDWLTNHILVEDRQITSWINKKEL